MSGADVIEGQCMCGAVTVSAKAAQPSLIACHCDMCRRWTSSAYMAFEAELGSVKTDGPVKTFVSSDWAERAFCETCGSALWYRITAPGPMHGQLQLAAGLFENAAGHNLKLEVYIDKKPNGYEFAGERRQMTEAEVEAMFAPSEEGETE